MPPPPPPPTHRCLSPAVRPAGSAHFHGCCHLIWWLCPRGEPQGSRFGAAAKYDAGTPPVFPRHIFLRSQFQKSVAARMRPIMAGGRDGGAHSEHNGPRRADTIFPESRVESNMVPTMSRRGASRAQRIEHKNWKNTYRARQNAFQSRLMNAARRGVARCHKDALCRSGGRAGRGAALAGAAYRAQAL